MRPVRAGVRSPAVRATLARCLVPLAATFLALTTAAPAFADGIDCTALEEWSEPVEGYKVNLHHVFCGEARRDGRARGFHAMPHGAAPGSFVSAEDGAGPNAAGVYTLRDVELRFSGGRYRKRFSTMFPDHCTANQVIRSIAYSRVHGTGSCASPAWARCGPSAPPAGDRTAFCVGMDGTTFTIASAALPGDDTRITTGFPIYEP